MSLKSIINAGSKIWLDSVDPVQTQKFADLGITGATSNPAIIADILSGGAFDQAIGKLIAKGLDNKQIAWEMTDELVADAQEIFLPVWEATEGDDGYVSFELDPLLEDPASAPPVSQRTEKYIELGRHYALEQDNRMIKVPATEGGIAALEALAAAGVCINVTLIFSMRQYMLAREAVWRGAQHRKNGLKGFKSVYSIFISRVDVYTEKQVPQLSENAQGMVGLFNAKQMWQANQKFWADKQLPLRQEMVFASTGKKLDWQAEDFYIEALVGSDIMTNPPSTNAAIEAAGKSYTRQIDQLPEDKVIEEIDKKVDVGQMESVLLSEGTDKFAAPFKKLLQVIQQKRESSNMAG